MPLYHDQLGRSVELQQAPRRIISVVPSQTELLADLGLEEEVIGITKFCVHPERWFRSKPRIGGTKLLHLDHIRQLKPDLILANKEENVKAQIEELAGEFPVWISDVYHLQGALDMITAVGEITGKQKEAQSLLTRIQTNFAVYDTPLLSAAHNTVHPASNQPLRTAYLIWKDPYMTVGGDTFIHDMLNRAGFENGFAGRNRYPEVTLKDLASCQLVLLSSEPFPFQQKHLEELQAQLPGTKIVLADGELFSWYGSRLEKAPAYFQQLRQQIQALSLF